MNKRMREIIYTVVIIIVIGKSTDINAESVIRSNRKMILKSYKLESNKTIIASPKEKYDENKIYEEMLNVN